MPCACAAMACPLPSGAKPWCARLNQGETCVVVLCDSPSSSPVQWRCHSTSFFSTRPAYALSRDAHPPAPPPTSQAGPPRHHGRAAHGAVDDGAGAFTGRLCVNIFCVSFCWVVGDRGLGGALPALSGVYYNEGFRSAVRGGVITQEAGSSRGMPLGAHEYWPGTQWCPVPSAVHWPQVHWPRAIATV